MEEQNRALLEALLGRKPVMPEAYDVEHVGQGTADAFKALGAGFVDPFGLVGASARSWDDPNNPGMGRGEYIQRRLQEMRAGSPSAAGIGSMLLPGLGFAKGVGAVGRELIPGALILGNAGGYGGPAMQDLGHMLPPKRAQGSYPPDGAY